MRLVLLSVLSISLFGCSYLQSTYVGNKPVKTVLPGMQYRLPKTTFDVTATFAITKCEVSPVSNSFDLSYSTAVKVDELNKGDPDATYALDFEKLGGFTKTNKITATTTETGVLVLIGASATDHSAGLIADSVKTIANIAVASAIPQATIPNQILRSLQQRTAEFTKISAPLPKANIPYPLVLKEANFKQIDTAKMINEKYERDDPCKDINQTLISIGDLENGLELYKTAQKNLKNATARIEQIQGDLAYIKSEIEFHANNKNNERKKYFTQREQKLTEELEKVNNEKAGSQKSIQKYLNSESNLIAEKDKLKITKRYTLLLSQPSKAEIVKMNGKSYIERNTLSIGKEGISKVLNLPPAVDVQECSTVKQKSVCISQIPQVEILLVRSTSNEQYIGSNDNAVTGGAFSSGIFYRIPGEARLRVCQQSCGDFDTKTDIINQAVSIAQLGTVGNITLTNLMFSDNLVNLSFHSNGALQTMTYESQAQSEEARMAAIGASENYLNFVKDRNAAIRTANTEAQSDALADLQSQKNQLTEQQTILKMLQGQPASTTQHRIEAYEKQIELLKVQRRLIEEQRLTEEAMKSASPSL